MSEAPVADVPSRTISHARQQFVEVYGSALAHNAYLRISLMLLLLIVVGLVALNVRTQTQYAHLKPLVIRIDAVGRAEAVQYDAATYRPQPQELRYFLTQFVVKHHSRLRATLQRDYPESLFFLEPSLLDATITQNERSRVLDTFVTGADVSADEVDVVVQNVSLSELARSPYRASVTFQKVRLTPGTRQERGRDTYIAQIDFVFADVVPAAYVPVNPLGLQITYVRVDQAFTEAQS